MSSPVEKYSTRSGTQDEGKDYEFEMATLLALRSIRYAKNVSIAFNADGVGDFDDIILMVTTNNDERFDYLLQLKHKGNANYLTRKDLEEGKGKFPFTKYCEDMFKIKNDLVKIEKGQETIIDRLGLFSNMYFVLFTNRGMDMSNFEGNKYLFYEIDKDKEETFLLKTLLNTSCEDDCVFKFILSDFPKKISCEDPENFRNFRFFTNQINLKGLRQKIAEEIKAIAPFNLLKKDEEDIADEFIIYVKNWANGLLVHSHYLTKEEIIFKLTELYLSQYEVNLRTKSFQNYDSDKKKIWNQLVIDKKVTILNSNNENVFNFMIQYLSNEVGQYCSSKEYWKDKLSQEEQQEFYQDHEDLKQPMLKTVTNNGKITLINIYKCLWRVKKIPLLVQIENLKEYENIINILKLSGFTHSVIILNSASEALLFLPPRDEDLSFFVTLQDLNKEKRDMVLGQPAQLQGRNLNQLSELVDESMFEDIKSCDIINILSGTFCIGKKLNNLPQYFIHRNTTKTFIKKHVFDNLKYSDDKFYFNDCNGLPNYPDLIYTNLPKALKEKKDSESLHYFAVHNEKLLEWRSTIGSTEKIKPFKDPSKIVYVSNISYYSANHTNIISEVPGMGKSIFMDYVAHKTPTTKWVLRIDLNKHLLYYRRNNNCQNQNTKAEKHLNYFFGEEDILAKKVFEKLLNAKKVIVLLDGFDETSIAHKRDVTNIAMSLQKGFYHIWLTTRPHMQEHLEEKLNTFAISLQPFTEDNQKQFLINYFIDKTNGCSNKKRIQEFVEGLLKATKKNLYDYEAKFTGIPLQTELLADYFIEKCKNCLENISSPITFNEKFDLLNLYENFINKKIERLEIKYDQSALADTDKCRKDQPLLALQLVFPLEEFEEIPGIKEKIEYYQKELDKIQQLQRDGVLTIDETFTINCNHRTFAEFLAARWLSDNLKETKLEIVHDLIKERFSKNYQFLFNIFDRILAQDCDFHMAIIFGQWDKAKKLILVDELDDGGRNVLHMLALYDEEDLLSENTNSVALEIIKNIPNVGKLCTKRDLLGFTPLDYALANKSSLILANALCQGPNLAPIKAYIELDFIPSYLTNCEKLGLKILFDMLLPYFLSRDFLQDNTSNTNVKAYLSSKSFDRKSKYVSHFVGSTITKYLSQSKLYSSDLRYTIRFEDNQANIEKIILSSKIEEINAKDVDKNTPLYYAILNKNLETVRILLEKGADINKKNSKNRTALHFALEKGNLDIIKLILSKNPDYKAFDNKGQNILHYAIIYGYTDDIIELIKEVDVNKQDHKGNTPLHLALQENATSIAKLLIEFGADPKILNHENRNALHYIILYQDNNNNIDINFCKNVDANIQDMEGNTPLHLELKKNSVNINNVQFLIKIKANVTLQNLNKQTPLHLILNNNPNPSSDAIIKLLVDQGADVNIQNSLEETALHWAIKNRANIEIVRYLLLKLKEVNKTDCYGNTCLHLAARNGLHKIVELLIINKMNFNGLNIEKETPLHLATKSRSLPTMLVLLNKRASVNKKNKDGNTPLHLAVIDDDLDAVKLLVVNGGADVNIPNNRRQSSLYLANKNKEMYALLSEYAKKNQQTQMKNSSNKKNFNDQQRAGYNPRRGGRVNNNFISR